MSSNYIQNYTYGIFMLLSLLQIWKARPYIVPKSSKNLQLTNIVFVIVVPWDV